MSDASAVRVSLSCVLIAKTVNFVECRSCVGHFVLQEEIEVKKDTERQDEIKAMKQAWEAAEPGRAAKVEQITRDLSLITRTQRNSHCTLRSNVRVQVVSKLQCLLTTSFSP